jgi:SH3-like domain-containing protein
VKFLSAKLFLPVLAAAALLAGCARRERVLEIDYVSAPEVILRDHLAAVFEKTGSAKNGDRVEVLDREKRFARVRTASGAEGWVEQRYLVTQQVFDGFQKLKQQEQNSAVEGTATTRNDTNLHLDPGRDTEHLYQLSLGAKVSVLRRATVEKGISGAVAKAVPRTASAKAKSTEVQQAMEDWWLVRDPDGHVGWVLGRLIDLDVPLEIAQYAEGERIVAYFVLDEVNDGDKKVAQYLTLMTESKDGLPYDFNQARVFTWNVKRHRYETAYREHGLNGVLPVTVTHENFGKEGDLPVFVLRVKDAAGNLVERKYKMNTPMVRRVGS